MANKDEITMLLRQIATKLDNLCKVTLSVQETAVRLGLSEPNVRKLTRRADFPPMRVGGRVLIDAGGLENWVRIHAHGGEQIEQ